MTNYVYIAVSLDGFIATREGNLDWLTEIPNPENTDFGFAEFMKNIDAIVMGRKTFEKVLTFGTWPYTKPVFVPSSRKITIPKNLDDKVKPITGTPKKIVKQLRNLGHQNLYIDGGVTIQGFLEQDLIDEMIITRVSILLGDGIPLFGKLTQKLRFMHKKTESLNENLVKSYYSRIRK
ncbi:MAG: dihydrofolate reductase family protein [Candidatus Thorarchaeota archaeon]|jgi:dihydrofolate reductase